MLNLFLIQRFWATAFQFKDVLSSKFLRAHSRPCTVLSGHPLLSLLLTSNASIRTSACADIILSPFPWAKMFACACALCMSSSSLGHKHKRRHKNNSSFVLLVSVLRLCLCLRFACPHLSCPSLCAYRLAPPVRPRP